MADEETDQELKVLDDYKDTAPTEEQKKFAELPTDDKLTRLNHLLQQSQLYSLIILDNMLERSLQKKQPQDANGLESGSEDDEPSQKKRKQASDEDLESSGSDIEELSTPRVLKKQSHRRTRSAKDTQVVSLDSDESNSDLEIVEVKAISGPRTRNLRRDGTKRASKRKRANEKTKPQSKASKRTQETKLALEQAQTGHNQQQPKLVSGCTMKDYQLDGLEWLMTLYENGLNGILADEMGLGKTLQCISLFACLMEHGIKGPFLVVAPLSTVPNWCNEFNKFAPNMKVVKYIGSKESRAKVKMGKNFKANVVVTSYEIIIKDFKKFNSIKWEYLTVDEGHRLKNFECLLIKFLKKLNVSNRLLLTGTPLQNNLNELWSLLNFILPDIFQDLELFQLWFDFDGFEDTESEGTEVEKRMLKLEVQQLLIKNLHSILKPFLLRRLKKDVIKDLPPKKEYIIYASLTPIQKIVYGAAMNDQLHSTVLDLYLKEYLMNNQSDLFKDIQDLRVVDKIIKNHTSEYQGDKRRRFQLYDTNVLSDYLELRSSDDVEAADEGYEPDTGEKSVNNSQVEAHNTVVQLGVREVEDEYARQSQKLEDALLLEMKGESEMNGKANGHYGADYKSDRFNGHAIGDFDNLNEPSAADLDLLDDTFHSAREEESKEDTKDSIVSVESGLDSSVIEVNSDDDDSREDQQAQHVLKLYDGFGSDMHNLRLKNLVMQLRKICGSHYVYYQPFSDVEDHVEEFSEAAIEYSGKFQVLQQLLQRLLKDKHKVLIFSQFTTMLDLIATALDSMDIRYNQLDGRINHELRQVEIDEFTSDSADSCSVFLLSTRAGGLGLNLISADTVILFDNDWNPQMDLQAIDRVHRIGQTKPVKIYRLVVRNTVEELLIIKSFNKRLLEKMVIQLGQFQIGSVAQRLVDEKIDMSTVKSMRAVLSLGEKLQLYEADKSDYSLERINEVLLQRHTSKNKLSEEEMDELMDRSPECYTRELINFENVTSFETTNNIDGGAEHDE